MTNGHGDEPEGAFSRKLEELKLNALAEFAAGAGHEINNPLAIISGHTQLLLKETTDPNVRHHLSIILGQTRRAYEMIADIRLFARPPQPQLCRLSLDCLLQRFVEHMNETWHEDRAVFTHKQNQVDTSKEIFLDTDESHLMTVLSALGKNAVEAIRNMEQEELNVFLEWTTEETDEGTFAVIFMEDNGTGIPPEIREHIFSPYYSGRLSGRGLGFGLSKAWRLMKGLKGDISLVSSKRFTTGCRWRLSLPLC